MARALAGCRIYAQAGGGGWGTGIDPKKNCQHVAKLLSICIHNLVDLNHIVNQNELFLLKFHHLHL